MVKHLILFLLFGCIMADHTFDGRIPRGSSKFYRASDTNVMPSVSRSEKSDSQILLKFYILISFNESWRKKLVSQMGIFVQGIFKIVCCKKYATLVHGRQKK